MKELLRFKLAEVTSGAARSKYKKLCKKIHLELTDRDNFSVIQANLNNLKLENATFRDKLYKKVDFENIKPLGVEGLKIKSLLQQKF